MAMEITNDAIQVLVDTVIQKMSIEQLFRDNRITPILGSNYKDLVYEKY